MQSESNLNNRFMRYKFIFFLKKMCVTMIIYQLCLFNPINKIWFDLLSQTILISRIYPLVRFVLFPVYIS